MTPRCFLWALLACGIAALAMVAGPLAAATSPTATFSVPTVTLQATSPPAAVTPEGTPIPAAGVVLSFLRPAVDPQALHGAVAVIETRLRALDVERPRVTVSGENHIMVEMPFPLDLDLAIASFRQPGLIQFLHAGEHTGPSFRASLLGQTIDPGAYEVVLAGDVFEAASVQPVEGEWWAVTFRLKPDAQAAKAAFAGEHPGAALLVALDDVVIGIIGVGSQTVSGLSYHEARLLAAFMRSGPLPLALEHYMNDYPAPTLPPSTGPASPTTGAAITIERTPLATATPTRPPNPHVMTGPAAVAIRSGPGEAFPAYATFGPHQGTAILAVSADRAWYYVDWPPDRGGPGWIPAAGLETTGDLDRLPVNPGPPIQPEDARRLAYTTWGVARVVHLDTGEEVILNGYGGLDAHRSVGSPDGRWVASWRHRAGRKWQLSLLDTTTWQRTELGEFWSRYPTLSWSPNSRWLAFGAKPSDRRVDYDASELFMLDVETGALRRLTSNTYRDDSPGFSPDGTRLVFTSAQDGYNRLHVLNIRTGERHLLTGEAFGYSPVWSPGGQWIAFTSNHEDLHQQLYVIRADGTGLRRVTYANADAENPVWVP